MDVDELVVGPDSQEITEMRVEEQARPEAPDPSEPDGTAPKVIAVGQRWQDNDRRSKGRVILVTEIDGEHAHASIEGTPRTTKIRIDRFKPGSTGWTYLGETAIAGPQTNIAVVSESPYDGEGTAQALTVRANQVVLLGDKFEQDRYGLSLNPRAGKPTIHEAEVAVDRIVQIRDGLQYWIGDILNVSDSLFHEEAAQLIDDSRFSESTVRVCTWVAARVPIENRREAQSWSHAQAVAALTPMQQRKWLRTSRENDWSVSKLKTEIAQSTEEGRSKLRFTLVIDCLTEAKQEKLEKELSEQGYPILRKAQTVKREKKAAKAKKVGSPKPKKGEVTAKGKGTTKMSAKRRVPQGWDVKQGGKSKKK